MGSRKRAEDRGLIKRGGMWHVRTDPVTGRQASTGCRTLDAAREWRKQREIAAANPAHAAAQAATVGEWCRKLLAAKIASRSEGTVGYSRTKLGHWVRLHEQTRLADVNPGLIDEYVTRRREEGSGNDRTISKEIGEFLQVLKLAKRSGCFPGDIESLRPRDLDDTYVPIDRWLQGPEVTLLLTKLEPHRGAFVALCVGLGVRKSEAFSLTPAQIDTVNWRAFIAGTKTDGSRRWVPILTPFRQLVAAALPYLPLQPWGKVSRDLAVACRRAGVRRVSPNDLRRSQATMLAEAGVPPDVIRRLLGHTTTKLVEQVYARPRAEIIGQQAEEKLVGVAPVLPASSLRRCDSFATVYTDGSPIEARPGRFELPTLGSVDRSGESAETRSYNDLAGSEPDREHRATLSDSERRCSERCSATETRQWPAAAMSQRRAFMLACLGMAAERMGVAA